MAQIAMEAGADWQAGADDRAAALRRMRWLATGLLGLMLMLFVVCWSLEGRFPWLAYPAAFAEAGMVGACADWFAVVALFRRPLGLPIPHTAILPRNKQRLAEQLGAFIAGNFLAPAEITPRLARLDLAGWIGDWLEDPANVDLVVECSHALLPPALEMAGDAELRAFGQGLIRDGVDSIAAAPMAGRALASVVKRGYHEAAYDRGVDWAIRFLRENRTSIRAKAAERSAGWLPRWVDAKAADVFIIGLLETLEAAREPKHPWRGEYEALLQRMIDRFANDRDTYDKCEQIKSDVLDARLVDSYLTWLSDQAEARLKEELDAGGGMVTRALQQGLRAIGTWLDEDERVREMINRWARDVVLATVVPNRSEIGAFVTDVVARWDTATLVQRLELHVGRDLQYIRINGTVVGGLVGLALFIATKLLGG
jgi:uncharacterized membrane-anchored protein YjiN (DUF445 family)